MQSLFPKKRNVKYSFCPIDVFTEYAWVKSLKDKKGKRVLHAFIKIVHEANRKPNKLWVNQVRESYSKLMEKWLHNNNILIYST